MDERTEHIIMVVVPVVAVVTMGFVFCHWVGYMIGESEREMHERIKDNINLSKPFNEVIGVSSDFICGGEEGWYFVSILVTTDEYPGSPQWIYDFRYDDNTDTLYYDDNIEGIGVVN
jgi:hypothetical protein